jgi:hypothetical protein
MYTYAARGPSSQRALCEPARASSQRNERRYYGEGAGFVSGMGLTVVLSSSHHLVLILFKLMPFRSLCYRFGNPARPLPNRTLGGTNLRADMAPVRSDMAVSGCSVMFDSSASDCLPSSVVGRSWTTFCFELWSPIRLARRRDSLLGILADDLRLLWPGASFNSDRLPSMPSLVIPKK